MRESRTKASGKKTVQFEIKEVSQGERYSFRYSRSFSILSFSLLKRTVKKIDHVCQSEGFSRLVYLSKAACYFIVNLREIASFTVRSHVDRTSGQCFIFF